MFLIPLVTRMSKHPWINTLFSAVREKTLESSGAIIPLAMLIASTIVAIKLIKMTYTIAADERAGGFGGVTLWEIARPIIILVAIINSPFILSTVDGICDGTATRIINSTNRKETNATITAMLAEIRKSEDELTNTANKKTEIKKHETDSLRHLRSDLSTGYFNQGTQTVVFKANDPAMQALVDSLNNTINNNEGYMRGLARVINSYQGVNAKLAKNYEKAMEDPSIKVGPRTFFTSLAIWINDQIFLWMMGFCDIFLCCLAYMFPITLALSLVDKWKGAVWSFTASYITISFWKVINAIINLSISQSYSAAIASVKDLFKDALANSANSINDAELVSSANTAGLITTTIAIAGIIATLSIPKITSTVLSLGVSPDGDGAAKAGGAIFSGAGKLAGSAGKGVDIASSIKTLRK